MHFFGPFSGNNDFLSCSSFLSFVTFQCGFLQNLHGIELPSVQSSDLPHQKHLQASPSTLSGLSTTKQTKKNHKRCAVFIFGLFDVLGAAPAMSLTRLKKNNCFDGYQSFE